jgi:undecaprenyl pyrophosphate phosphatase UppP
MPLYSLVIALVIPLIVVIFLSKPIERLADWLFNVYLKFLGKE